MDRTKIALTRAMIDGARPQGKPYRLWDDRVPGLFMRVQPSGTKTWNVQWRRASSKSLGRYPVMPLDAARKMALAVLGDAAINGTPDVARQVSKNLTLRAFMAAEYLPWAQANLKWGRGTCERIESVFVELLSRTLREITPWVVEKWRSRRLDQGISANTCNRDLASLRSALGKAVQWGFLKENPFADIKASKVDAIGVVRFLSSDEERRLREALTDRDRAMRAARERANAWRADRGKLTKCGIAVDGFGDHLTPLVLTALNTGLRRGELISLTWSDIDLNARRLTVRAGYAKSGKARHVPLNSEATDVLKRWKAQTEEHGQVFILADPKTAWARLLKAAEVGNFRFHDLRHHFASRLVMAGVDLNTVRELLGHSDLKMTLRYAHLAPEHKADAVERLVSVAPQKKAGAAHEEHVQTQH